MKFRKFVSIFIIIFFVSNSILILEPLLVFEGERNGENKNPVANGDYYKYRSSGSSEVIGIEDGVYSLAPVGITITLHIVGKRVRYEINISGSNLKNVSGLGYHRYVNMTKCFNISNQFIQNFILQPTENSENKCIGVDNESLIYMCTFGSCYNYGKKYQYYSCATDSTMYGILNCGSKEFSFDNYCFVKAQNDCLMSSLNLFEGNIPFLYQMLNDTSFKNTSLKGFTEFSLELVSTNVEFSSLFYTYYFIQNLPINFILSFGMLSFLLAVYVNIKRKRRG